jgi:hypothetical protein
VALALEQAVRCGLELLEAHGAGGAPARRGQSGPESERPRRGGC